MLLLSRLQMMAFASHVRHTVQNQGGSSPDGGGCGLSPSASGRAGGERHLTSQDPASAFGLCTDTKTQCGDEEKQQTG